MSLKIIISLLKDDLLFYKNFPNKKITIYDLLTAAIISRDFRLNVLIRFLNFNHFYINKISEKLVFYLYGSSISTGAILNCKLRFTHARSIVIGRHVKIESGFAYFFNNVVIGKKTPGSDTKVLSMPQFEGNCVFGTGTIILGSLIAERNIVFAAGSVYTSGNIKSNATIISNQKVKKGVFFELNENGNPTSFPLAF